MGRKWKVGICILIGIIVCSLTAMYASVIYCAIDSYNNIWELRRALSEYENEDRENNLKRNNCEMTSCCKCRFAEEVSEVEDTTSSKPKGNDLFACPYCNNKLASRTSTYLTSTAYLECSFCGYRTPKVNSKLPDKELECLEKCKENFKTDIWPEEDILGDK